MAHQTEDIFSFAALDPLKLGESFREMARLGAVTSKQAYAGATGVAEEVTKTLATSLHIAQAGTAEAGLKGIDAIRASADISLSHVEALLGVKSVSELVELQASYLRRQAEVTIEHARVLQETAVNLAEDVAKPGKEAVDKVMAAFKRS